MKITLEHHRQMPLLKRLTAKLTTEQTALLETLLDAVYREGRSRGYSEGNPNSDED